MFKDQPAIKPGTANEQMTAQCWTEWTRQAQLWAELSNVHSCSPASQVGLCQALFEPSLWTRIEDKLTDANIDDFQKVLDIAQEIFQSSCSTLVKRTEYFNLAPKQNEDYHDF